MRKILVTSALPYANGPLHLGHMLEHIQTDIWVRSLKMMGHQCLSVCGDDAHGTPIMLKAESMGITPEALIKQTQACHEDDFNKFNIHYDQYHTTHSKENKALSSSIYLALKDNGDIKSKVIEQFFDPEKEMFLSDQALGALMMALQKSLLEQSDIVPVLKDFKLKLSEQGLVVMNPPLVKVPNEDQEEEE